MLASLSLELGSSAVSSPGSRDLLQVARAGVQVLPAHVGAPEIMEERVDIDGLRIYVVGLAVALEDGDLVTGAAASLNEAPFERARFELLERLVIAGAPFQPSEPASASQRWSRSSGVALHADAERASARARLELIERDRVLRSWYGGARPRLLEAVRVWPESLERHYSIGAFGFDEGIDSAEGARVVGIVAFPKRADVPLSMGFAARGSLREALDSACSELLQQIAFGWGEPIQSDCPEVAATPEFHLDYYAYPANHRLLEAWLSGEHEGRGPELPDVAGTFRFAEITPSWMGGGLCVVRAEHRAALPLAFGRGHPWFRELPEFMQVQPMA